MGLDLDSKMHPFATQKFEEKEQNYELKSDWKSGLTCLFNGSVIIHHRRLIDKNLNRRRIQLDNHHVKDPTDSDAEVYKNH